MRRRKSCWLSLLLIVASFSSCFFSNRNQESLGSREKLLVVKVQSKKYFVKLRRGRSKSRVEGKLQSGNWLWRSKQRKCCRRGTRRTGRRLIGNCRARLRRRLTSRQTLGNVAKWEREREPMRERQCLQHWLVKCACAPAKAPSFGVFGTKKIRELITIFFIKQEKNHKSLKGGGEVE